MALVSHLINFRASDMF